MAAKISKAIVGISGPGGDPFTIYWILAINCTGTGCQARRQDNGDDDAKAYSLNSYHRDHGSSSQSIPYQKRYRAIILGARKPR